MVPVLQHDTLLRRIPVAAHGHDESASDARSEGRPVVPGDEVQGQVDPARDPRGGVHDTIRDVEHVGHHRHGGVPASEAGLQGMVGRGAPAVEYADGREGERPGADARDLTATPVVLADGLAQVRRELARNRLPSSLPSSR